MCSASYLCRGRLGTSPAQVIRARPLWIPNDGWGADISLIERGKFADFVAVCGDPLAGISELQRVKFVMKGRQLLRNDLNSPGTKGCTRK